MFRCLFIVLFFTSSCSIYDLSSSKGKIEDFFSDKTSIIVLSPSIESTLYADNITLEAIIQDSLGIKQITITPSSEIAITINPTGHPKKFGISQNLSISNQGTYNTSHGKYPIKISYENSVGDIITKDFIFTIKLLSVDYLFTPSITAKPPSGPWSVTDLIRIYHFDTGAPLKRIEIAGALGSFITNAPFVGIESGEPIVKIRMNEISGTTVVPVGDIAINVRIISDTGGTSMETIVLR